jgi:hypothetical protein
MAALQSNTTASYNVANGHRALFSNTTGYSNTASGANALYANTTGTRNTASGVTALRNNTTGSSNTASGYLALRGNTTASHNTAFGAEALSFNTGPRNTALGFQALRDNTTGYNNTASGFAALRFNTLGIANTATGYGALHANTGGILNTACGFKALNGNTTGQRNIALGQQAGLNLTTGNDNIAIGNAGVAAEAATIRMGTAGTHTRAFIAGIRGATTGVANAIPVLIDGNGQLGTISSSRRFKEEIRDMGDATERLSALRPVTFRYKPEIQAGERPLEYGLIAEEVAEVFPELVVFDEEGKPFTVKYHLLSTMLLNELERLRADHGRELAELRTRLGAVEERCVASEAAPTALAR